MAATDPKPGQVRRATATHQQQQATLDSGQETLSSRRMIQLAPIIERIETLLHDGTDASTTYAALEARLALEKVCYDRLRQAHDYIAHEQLRRWQPREVMTTLIQHVDQHAALTMKLSMSTKPVSEDNVPEDREYAEIGTQVGFDPAKIGRLWQALSGLALHVKLPMHRTEHIPAYGDPQKTRAKVLEVLAELRRLAKGTLVTSGVGMEVKFDCVCGEENKRRAGLLKEGDSVFCINPRCDESYTISFEGEDTLFEREMAQFDCASCKAPQALPRRWLNRLPIDHAANLICHACGYSNHVQWVLAAKKLPDAGREDGPG